MSNGYTYYKGLSTGPAMPLAWKKRGGTLYNFATGYTFSGLIVISGLNAILRTKTAGITGSDPALTLDDAGNPYNVLIDYETADFTPLTAPGEYQVILTATPTSGDPIVFDNRPTFTLRPAPT